MPNKKKPVRKKRGAVSASGKVGLRFKKGSPNDTSIPVKKIRTKRLTDKKKTIPGHIGTRQSGETVQAFKARRDKYRKSLKK